MTNFDEKWLMQAIEAVSSGFTKKIARDNILVYRIDQAKPLIRIDTKLAKISEILLKLTRRKGANRGIKRK